MKTKMLIFSLLLLFIPLVFAQDITLSLNQTDYYFRVGEEALINLYTHNTYDEAVGGSFSYTLRQSVHQENLQYSNSNTQSIPFSIEPGEKTVPLSFGTSDTPSTIAVDLTFSYSKKSPITLPLTGISIHFVNEDAQKQNKQNQIKSSSQQQTNPFEEQGEKMRQMMDDFFKNVGFVVFYGFGASLKPSGDIYCFMACGQKPKNFLFTGRQVGVRILVIHISFV